MLRFDVVLPDWLERSGFGGKGRVKSRC